MEEAVEIMDREVKQLKHSPIPIFKHVYLSCGLATANLGIHAVVLRTTSVAAFMYHFYLNYNNDQVFPFLKTIFYRNYEYVKVANSSKDKEEDRVMQCVAHSSNIVLVKSFKEIKVLEDMKYGVPIIAMPMHLDQPINARLVVDVRFGVEVVRVAKVLRWRDNVAKVVK
uniref:Beta-D-glucosyl crocetin beta-1,6-glucosyltransferase-like n=1 Tax=Tanacetum cinerariifolium TaxID=118510 RepID=A0A699HWI3_TANCI|nr:beta-D-glucosyl crocetin beta-1,6-glucosyltransferase-like [Tanacetum cinerariifolium]